MENEKQSAINLSGRVGRILWEYKVDFTIEMGHNTDMYFLSQNNGWTNLFVLLLVWSTLFNH